MTENDLAFLKQAAEQLGLDADTAFVHVSPMPEPCDHEWNNGGRNPDHCVKCGMSIHGACVSGISLRGAAE